MPNARQQGAILQHRSSIRSIALISTLAGKVKLMRLLNRVELIGEVADTPMMRVVENDIAVCTFRLVTYEAWNDENLLGQYDYEWHHILAWGKLAEICHTYIRKGMPVYIEGRLKQRALEHTSSDADQRIYITEVVANDLILLEYVNKEYGGETHHFSDWADEDKNHLIRYEPPGKLDSATNWRLKHKER